MFALQCSLELYLCAFGDLSIFLMCNMSFGVIPVLLTPLSELHLTGLRLPGSCLLESIVVASINGRPPRAGSCAGCRHLNLCRVHIYNLLHLPTLVLCVWMAMVFLLCHTALPWLHYDPFCPVGWHFRGASVVVHAAFNEGYIFVLLQTMRLQSIGKTPTRSP